MSYTYEPLCDGEPYVYHQSPFDNLDRCDPEAEDGDWDLEEVDDDQCDDEGELDSGIADLGGLAEQAHAFICGQRGVL